MREFDGLGEFGRFLELLAAEATAEIDALDKATALLQKKAKDKIGHYQPEAGPFLEWAPLAPATLSEKEGLGYSPPDNPLLRTGETRASIQRKFEVSGTGPVHESVGLVGSDDDVMVWQELGTRTIPPRSVLGSTAVENADRVAKIIGSTVAWSLMGSGVAGEPLLESGGEP